MITLNLESQKTSNVSQRGRILFCARELSDWLDSYRQGHPDTENLAQRATELLHDLTRDLPRDPNERGLNLAIIAVADELDNLGSLLMVSGVLPPKQLSIDKFVAADRRDDWRGGMVLKLQALRNSIFTRSSDPECDAAQIIAGIKGFAFDLDSTHKAGFVTGFDMAEARRIIEKSIRGLNPPQSVAA